MLLHLLTHEPRALLLIVQKTPVWVWVLLGGLIALGVSQGVPRSVSAKRVLLMPIAMAGLSGWGVYATCHNATQAGQRLAIWLFAGLITMLLTLWWQRSAPTAARYDATSRKFQLPGSAWPMVLILGIFLVKYGVAVELAMQPALANDSTFMLPVALAYGGFSGALAARTVRWLRLIKCRPAAQNLSPLLPRTTP